METNLLKHPLIAQTVAAIVAEGGGCVEYDIGGGGREVLIAASAQLAAATNSQLTIVESRVLHSQIRAMVSELQTEVFSAVLSTRWPEQLREQIRSGSDLVDGIHQLRDR
ncbi:hypothetical protein ACWEKM_43430 [Streptomyces sp. NPDC004752]